MMRWWKIIFWIFVILVIAAAIFLVLNFRSATATQTTNISATSTEHFAWDDIDGWWNFYDTASVIVKGSKIEGYASSSVSDMSLDCYTTRNGNICGLSNYGICNGIGATHNSDGTCSNPSADGTLSGYSWNETIGWISFCGGQGTSQCPGATSYGVTVSNTNGAFSGYAWNDAVGWISFSGSGYGVITSWRATSSIAILESSILDTQLQSGGILNSILWKGEQPASTCVKFQIATSGSQSGPWTYYGTGPNINQYFGGTCPGPDYIIGITGADRLWVNNTRYLRYKIFLTSDLTQTKTPVVEDVILNWSR